MLTSSALLVSACTGSSGDDSSGDTGGKTQSDSAKFVENPAEGEPKAHHDAALARGDRFPEMKWNQPLPEDVTEEQLQTWLDEGRLPLGEAHGGVFETMTNALAATKKTPDVAFMGDSMTQQGVDPEVVERKLSYSTGEDIRAFNAASSRARWGINKMMVKYMVKVDRVPDVVVLVISTRAAEGDEFYKEDPAHAPFSSVVEGCDREESKTWTKDDEEQCRKDNRDLRVRYRESGAQVARARAGKKANTSVLVDEKSALRSDGMLLHPSMSEAEVQKASDQRTKRGFPGFPRVEDQAVRDFGETKEILEAHGANVISTEIPYSPPHQKNLESFGEYDEKRQDAAKELSGRNDVEHFPVDSYGSWWGDGDSRDAIHLAPQGAASFTAQLLDDTPGFKEAVEDGIED